jgi:hypothetical protein
MAGGSGADDVDGDRVTVGGNGDNGSREALVAT